MIQHNTDNLKCKIQNRVIELEDRQKNFSINSQGWYTLDVAITELKGVLA